MNPSRRPASPDPTTAASNIDHNRAMGLLSDEDRVEIEALKAALISGSLVDSHAVSSHKDRDEGMAASVAKNVPPQHARYSLPTVFVDQRDRVAAMERSALVVALQQKRADAALRSLQRAFQFVNQYDDHKVLAPMTLAELDRFVATAQARIAKHNPHQYQSNLHKYERLAILEIEADSLVPSELLAPDLDAEREVLQLGMKLGLLDEYGKWKPKCSCEGKLEMIRQTARAEERRIAKAKYVTSFVRELDNMVCVVNDFLQQALATEETRAKELTDMRENQMLMMGKLEAQKGQIARLKSKAKDTTEDPAEKDQSASVTSLKDYIAVLEREKARGQDKEKDTKYIPRRHYLRNMKRMEKNLAAHERCDIALHDTDGHVDQAAKQYMEMRNKKKAFVNATMQTMTEEDLFLEHGITSPAKRMRRSSTVLEGTVFRVPLPAWETDGKEWPMEAASLGSCVKSLSQTFATSIETLEGLRARAMSQVATKCPADSDMERELAPLFTHTNSTVRETLTRTATEVKHWIVKIAANAKMLVADVQKAARIEASEQLEKSKQQAPGDGIRAGGGQDAREEESSDRIRFKDYVTALESELLDLRDEVKRSKAEQDAQPPPAQKPPPAEDPQPAVSLLKKKSKTIIMASKAVKEMKEPRRKSVAPPPAKEPKEPKEKASPKKPAEKIRQDTDAKPRAQFIDVQATSAESFDLDQSAEMSSQSSIQMKAFSSAIESIRESVIAVSKVLSTDDGPMVRNTLLDAIKTSTPAQLPNVCKMWAKEIATKSEAPKEPISPPELAEVARKIKEAASEACMSAVQSGITLPSELLPAIESQVIFARGMPIADLCTLLVDSSSHLASLGRSIKSQIPELLMKECAPWMEHLQNVTKAVKDMCVELPTVFPMLFVDFPVQEMQICQVDDEAEHLISAGKLARDALDNLLYFLQDLSQKMAVEREEYARHKAEELSTAFYNKMVAENDRIALREAHRASKAKKEADDRIRAESMRFQEQLETETSKARQQQLSIEENVSNIEAAAREAIQEQQERINVWRQRAEDAEAEAESQIVAMEQRAALAKMHQEIQLQIALEQHLKSIEMTLYESESDARAAMEELEEIEMQVIVANSELPIESGTQGGVHNTEDGELPEPLIFADAEAQTDEFVLPSVSQPFEGLGPSDSVTVEPSVHQSEPSTSVASAPPHGAAEMDTLRQKIPEEMPADKPSRTPQHQPALAQPSKPQVVVLQPPPKPPCRTIQIQTTPVRICAAVSVKDAAASVCIETSAPTPKLPWLEVESELHREQLAHQLLASSKEEKPPMMDTASSPILIPDEPSDSVAAEEQRTPQRPQILVLHKLSQTDHSGSIPATKTVRRSSVADAPTPSRRVPPRPTQVHVEQQGTQASSTLADAENQTEDLPQHLPQQLQDDDDNHQELEKECQTEENYQLLVEKAMEHSAGRHLAMCTDAATNTVIKPKAKDASVQAIRTAKDVQVQAVLQRRDAGTVTPKTWQDNRGSFLVDRPPELSTGLHTTPSMIVVASEPSMEQEASFRQDASQLESSPDRERAVCVDSMSQTQITAVDMSELGDRPKMRELLSLTRAVGDLNREFCKVMAKAAYVANDLEHYSPKLLSSCDLCLSQCTMYLRDLTTQKSSKFDLFPVLKRNDFAQVKPEVRSQSTQANEQPGAQSGTHELRIPNLALLSALDSDTRAKSPRFTPRSGRGEFVETPRQALSRAVTPQGPAKQLLSLEDQYQRAQNAIMALHAKLYEFLPLIAPHVKLENVKLRDPYPQLFGLSKHDPIEVLSHDTKLFDRLVTVLRRQRECVKKKISAAVEHATLNKKLENLVARRQANEFPEDIPQMAAFLDRQEERLRVAMETFEREKQRAVEEKEDALRDFFLPMTDVVSVPYMSQVLQRNKLHGAGAPRISTPIETTTAARCGPIAVKDFEDNSHPANSLLLNRTFFLSHSITGLIRAPPPCDRALPTGAEISQEKASPPQQDIYVHSSVPPRRLPTLNVPGRPPVARHIVIPQRTTQVQPAREFFMKPLEGHRTKIFKGSRASAHEFS